MIGIWIQTKRIADDEADDRPPSDLGALSNVSVQPKEADHAASKGDNRSALAANGQAERDYGRANGHHFDVGIIATVGVFTRPRGNRQTRGHVPGDAGRSDARTGRGRCVGRVDRSRPRVERHLSGDTVAITSRDLLR